MLNRLRSEGHGEFSGAGKRGSDPGRRCAVGPGEPRPGAGLGAGGFPAEPARGLQPPGAGALDAAFPQVVLPENQMPSQAFQTPRVKQDHRRARGCRICKSLPFHLSKEQGLRMGCIKYPKPISAALQSCKRCLTLLIASTAGEFPSPSVFFFFF